MRAARPAMVAIQSIRLLLLLWSLMCLAAGAGAAPEPRVLVYTKNQIGPGLYVPDNIAASVAAIRKLGADNHFAVEASDDPVVASAYRAGHRAEWQHIRQIHPGLPIMGNVDGDLSQPEYQGQLQGAFLEGLMGYNWSIEKWGGWAEAMNRYRAAMANTSEPHWVGFHVQGKTNDYRFLRYA